MAEFVATLFALVGVGIQTATTIDKVISGLRNAPKELLELSNEVTATNQVLDRARQVLEQHQSRSATRALAVEAHPVNFGHIIGRANAYYVRIMNTVESLKSQEKNGLLKYANRVMWMKTKERLKELQGGLRACREEIVHFVGVENL